MCIRDSLQTDQVPDLTASVSNPLNATVVPEIYKSVNKSQAVSYTPLRAHETVLDLVCRLLLGQHKSQYNDRPHLRIKTITSMRHYLKTQAHLHKLS